jgi:DNA invertase Pin-like site-specific DNA recombinase
MLFGMGERNIIVKRTTQNMARINREGMWGKRENWCEGIGRVKREEASG